MRVWTCVDHEGHWPVGVASVVVAETDGEAYTLLRAQLREHGLTKDEPFTLLELDTNRAQALVLDDGDY